MGGGEGISCGAALDPRSGIGLPLPPLFYLTIKSFPAPFPLSHSPLAQAALAFVRGRSDLDATRVVLFGRSLGGAVAASLAAAEPDKVGREDTAGSHRFESTPFL